MKPGSIPPITHETYNQSLYGFYGELGKSHFGVRFIQTALHVSDLDKITLVSEIPDSEKWPIRELFQRDIDSDRVDEYLIPYFKKPTKIKFFNPLTIVLLPIDKAQRILHGVEEVRGTDKKYMPDRDSLLLESHGYYCIQVPCDGPQWSCVKWNSQNVRLVAVDGQHRLCALKRLYTEYQRNLKEPELINVEFSSWTIPIVLIVFPPSTGKSDHLLANMRDIFITINTEAKTPNRCRTILLNDNSITSICCQELLDYCHTVANPAVPLLFFDWRAHDEHRNNPHPQHSAAFMRVEELEDLHTNYILGDDNHRQDQLTALFVNDMEEPLSEDELVMYSQIRKRYREILMPAFIHILSNFDPLVLYIKFLKNLPNHCSTPIQKHALSNLEYGVDYGSPEQRPHIQDELKNLKGDCDTRQSQIELLFKNLIGLRGIFSGFAGFRDSYAESMKKIISPLESAKLYVEHMNKAFKDKYLKQDCPHLTWVCVDPTHDEGIVNYKFSDQDKALGAYCALLACVFQSRTKFAEPIGKWLEILEDTIQKGYRRQVRPHIKEQNPTASLSDLKKLINTDAQKRTDKHMKKLREELDINA